MFQYHYLNKISEKGTALWTGDYVKTEDADKAQAIVVRSAAMHEMDFSDELLAVARAGAGVNNIPLDRCAQEGIVVFNTPGANANAVKELVLCAMLIGSRDIPDSIRWVQDQVAAGVDVTTVVEKGKSAFIGPELYHKSLGLAIFAQKTILYFSFAAGFAIIKRRNCKNGPTGPKRSPYGTEQVSEAEP